MLWLAMHPDVMAKSSKIDRFLNRKKLRQLFETKVIRLALLVNQTEAFFNFVI